MRICSFLPSMTEIVYALGLGDNLVGVTHECDYPPDATSKSRVIMSLVKPEELTSKEIDILVSENYKAGKSTYIVGEEALRKANPDIILTQGLCDVCAVSGNEVTEAVKVLGHSPQIISLEPNTLDEILDTILIVGEATERKDEAKNLVAKLKHRIERVKSLLGKEKNRPRVFCMEWLDPVYVAGHWIPEMVEIAGAECGLGKAGAPSFKVSWDEILDFSPQIIVLMPCGFDIEKTLGEVDILTSNERWHRLPAARKGHVYLVDANSYFSRPGPRIVDGLEILAKIFHPEISAFGIPLNSILNLRNHIYLESFLG
ncbi:MAG: cobalamin-binding protein [Deltaproteobacteria bacterium]|nr:cobalamin-binding protein [Deltaproteobacteria bacterium]